MTRQRAGRMAAGLLLALVAVAVPAAAAAHPLGNFTINHYAGLRIGASAVAIDVVIDHAEIPAFGERQRIDLDRDGAVSAAEQETERAAACGQLAGDLALIVANQSQTLVPVAAGLSFPAGAGGLPTMRLVCQYEVALASPITTATEVSFTDRSFSERVGWREIVVIGDGLAVPAGVPAASVSERLTAYPESLLATPPDVRSMTLSVAPGGAPAAPFTAPDAQPLVAEATPGAGDGASEVSAVPGGVGSEISALLRTQDLTPLVLLASLLAAALLGAGHALTPGHGKTIMAAYLVGSQGSARHAVGLGLATAVSHTIGVVALGALILAAGSALPAERIYPVLGLASALLVVAIGAWMVAGQWRVVAAAVRRTPAFAGAGAHHHAPHDPGHAHDHPHAHDHGSGHTHPHPHAHAAPGEVGWRSLFTLGLAGGLVPSTNALLILVATVATGRPAFGLVLVAAFGIGMAAVLVGLGIALVVAGDRLAGVGNRPWLTTVLAAAPVLGAFAVLTLGIFLTVGAVGGAAVL